MASSPSEHEIQQRIRLACGRGAVRFGLCKGSSDLIGLRSLEITPELVGQRLAQFVALEVKAAQGVPSPEQRRKPSSCLAYRGVCRLETDGSGRNAAAAAASHASPPR
jgi:hypothetical protein